jgi:hypothetical protein
MILEYYDNFYVILKSTLCYEMPDTVPTGWRHCVKEHAVEISLKKREQQHMYFTRITYIAYDDLV